MKTFYISDCHFGHGNVIKFDGRAFETVEEMEETMIENWNSVVDKEDKVYILGDFCWSKDEAEWIRILDRLNGSQKFLVKGNHDLTNMSPTLKNKFAAIYNYVEIKDNGRRVICCHYPMPFYRSNYNKNIYHLYGHVHVTLENDLLKEIKELIREKDNRGNSTNNCQFYNVGCMMPYMNYTPRTLDEIIEGAKIYEVKCINA